MKIIPIRSPASRSIIICDVYPNGRLPYRREYQDNLDGFKALQNDISKLKVNEARRIHVFRTELPTDF